MPIKAGWRHLASLLLAFWALPAANVPAAETAGEEVPEECRRPAGARGQGTPVAGAHGCTALDVIQFPGVVLDPLLGAIDDLVARFATPAATAPMRNVPRRLARARRLAERARLLLPEGAVCEGAAAARRTAEVLSRLEERAALRLREIGSEPQQDPQAGDAGDDGARWATVNNLQARLAQAGVLADEVVAVTDAVCRDLGPLTAVRGEVSKIDTARKRAVLTDGTVLGLLAQGYADAPHAGAAFSGAMRRLSDGTGLAYGYANDTPEIVELQANGCIELRIAPVQPFGPTFPTGVIPTGANGRRGLQAPPQGSEPYALHKIEAYPTWNGRTLLERGMRVAAVKRPCLLDTLDSETSNHRYSLDVDLEIGSPKKTHPLAWELDPGGPPSPQPDGIAWTGSNGTLTVRYKVEQCTLKPSAPAWVSRVSPSDVQACVAASGDCACTATGPGASCPVYPQWDDLDDYISPWDCTTPVVFDVKTFPLNVVEQGAECTADYTQETFDLEDHDKVGFRTSTVSGISPHGVLIFEPESSLHFWADGYAAAPPTPYFGSEYLASPIAVGVNQAFGVYTWEPCLGTADPGSNCFFPEDPDLALRRGGVATASALRWPRVVGEKSGQQYAYTCRLPELVRDAIYFCEGNPESFYRFPLQDGIWGISQGNCSCCGSCGCTHSCGGNQQYAFDVLANPYTPILAARGGVVAGKGEGDLVNCWGMATCPGGKWGNYITIEHQDGTASSYMHMPGNVLLKNIGTRVRRGDLIGFTGNTGNSSDPHVHFQEQESPESALTRLMRFDIWRWEGLDFIHHLCHTPQEGDALVSNNAPPP
jgi:peptidase M23-like protein